jgi:hypothetical protein
MYMYVKSARKRPLKLMAWMSKNLGPDPDFLCGKK